MTIINSFKVINYKHYKKTHCECSNKIDGVHFSLLGHNNTVSLLLSRLTLTPYSINNNINNNSSLIGGYQLLNRSSNSNNNNNNNKNNKNENRH